mmetsp:Transcript_39642/g.44256  ORF Transcript_39642/g.44256 Transcript_39642/m.44256 type:complete len:108 (-) Transcript_39642:193-516(-)
MMEFPGKEKPDVAAVLAGDEETGRGQADGAPNVVAASDSNAVEPTLFLLRLLLLVCGTPKRWEEDNIRCRSGGGGGGGSDEKDNECGKDVFIDDDNLEGEGISFFGK